MRVAVSVELEQKKSKTSFKVGEYEESASRGSGGGSSGGGGASGKW